MTVKEAINKLNKLERIKEAMTKDEMQGGNGKRINRKIAHMRELIKSVNDRKLGMHGL